MRERRALIVEDDPDMTRLIRRALAENDYGCVVSGSLAEAVRQLAGMVPDVVVLDLGLPDGNGLELLQQLRSDPLLSGALVVILSGHNKIGDMEDALELGADEYLFKPTSLGRISQALAKGLERNRHEAQAIARRSSLPVIDFLRSLWPGAEKTPSVEPVSPTSF